MTTLTPPPAGSAIPPVPDAPQNRPARRAGRGIAIATVALGAAVLTGTVVTGVVQAASASALGAETLTAAVDGIRELDVDASASNLTVVFADVSEATLEVDRGRTGWRMERDGDELQVRSPDTGWFGIGFVTGGNGRAVLTLPESLQGSDASLSLSSGSLTASGSFAELEAHVSAGDLTLEGDARDLSVEVGAGSADIRLADVSTADLDLSAGDLSAELTGDVPRTVEIEVGAGSMDLVLPRGDYDVRSDVSAGDLDNQLERLTTGVRGTIDARISAGDVTLRTGR